MANLYQHKNDLLLHLTVEDIYRIQVVRIKGGGRNFYGNYDVIHNNWIPIPKKLAMEVIDLVKEGKICDIIHAFHWDDTANF